ncbi:MAG: aminomethyl-transferring glycine dehydrogenase [Porticoccaceae bacterium]|nr:aminomethyl-transferring glycine dehydrogenase [Porticoccaceae bacterium]
MQRHLGPDHEQCTAMLDELGLTSLDELITSAVPQSILSTAPLDLPPGLSEQVALGELKHLAEQNHCFESLLGMGYHDTVVPGVIQRNVLENPSWYTAYTPYQPEIAQGRLEGLLNFQQMLIDLTGMTMANASVLDESTAAAEAMAMAKLLQKKNKSTTFFVDKNCHPQTLAVVKTRAVYFGFTVFVGEPATELDTTDYFAALLQYPGSSGDVVELKPLIDTVHGKSALAIVAADVMSLVLLRSPGEQGADIVIGSSQRFGVPLGYGGPHAGFMAFRETYKRSAPGRIIGVSVDQRGKPALRMALQTREQHIRREKANSNICTAQVLLALMSAFYAVYHGPDGLKRIATKIHQLTNTLAAQLTKAGFTLRHQHWFDTLCIEVGEQQQAFIQRAQAQHINLRQLGDDALCLSLNETSTTELIAKIVGVLGVAAEGNVSQTLTDSGIPPALLREDAILSHPVFNRYHSETEMLRYLKRLENKDISLTNSMIPLGSCTMKLNATAEMQPIGWPEFANLHPFAPLEQTKGYQQLFAELEQMLAACTGYAAVSLQPNAGSQGEYAGLLAISAYHRQRGEAQRNICLIPASAHGTNPASAQMAGMTVVVVKCDEAGDIDFDDLQAKAEKHSLQLAALMVTYPSTHGVFEANIRAFCEVIHQHGGQVYIDGANLNALIGIAALGEIGGDVSHINLHKTFAIPHGGGGPGMGPIAVGKHLQPFLPTHPALADHKLKNAGYTVSAAPWGSASILPVSWMYLKMMGADGLLRASQIAILSANYIAKKLQPHYPVLYTGQNGRVAHECIIDIRPLKASSGISEEDIAKRLMDYGFHAPTMSFPVAGTLMIEPTESESKAEIDRFISAMMSIREEIAKVENGEWPLSDNPLVNAPHTLDDVLSETWDRAYSREQATRPASWLKDDKYWPPLNRIDNVYGDRHVVCSCPPLSAYAV